MITKIIISFYIGIVTTDLIVAKPSQEKRKDTITYLTITASSIAIFLLTLIAFVIVHICLKSFINKRRLENDSLTMTSTNASVNSSK
jgi:hypothetical protein